MAFTATIQSINIMSNQWSVDVLFADSVSGYSSDKVYAFPIGTTVAQATATITSDGAMLKSNIAAAQNMQTKVGTVITI